jgi:hypothetical protein
VYERVGLADMAQKFIPRPAPLEAPLARPAILRNQWWRGYIFLFVHLRQKVQAGIRHTGHAKVWRNRRGYISGVFGSCPGQRVKSVVLPAFGKPTMPSFMLYRSFREYQLDFINYISGPSKRQQIPALTDINPIKFPFLGFQQKFSAYTT